MRIVLVNMPWASVEVPSLALGIVKATATATAPETDVVVVDANLDLIDWLCDRMPFTLEDYELFSLSTYFVGCGDWVFTGALYGAPWRLEEFRTHMRPHLSEQEAALAERLHALVPEFVDDVARRIVAYEPDLVGFTSTFQQNVAALAAARAVKELRPQAFTVFGGANCDGEQGAALHRNFPAVDFVIRGEGERALPALVRALTAAGDTRATDLARVPGLCWRSGEGTSVANPMAAAPTPPAAIPRPDFGGYFERLARSRAHSWVEPKLVVEGARGCWWGEKHHCTFCGLNGSFMQFRSKSPERFFDELVDLATKHQVLDFYVVDNIIDMAYLRSVLPRIVEMGYDFRFHYEIKSNMRRPQLELLQQAGLVHVQPGIESLSSRVLAIMDKGVTGCQNVRLLRDAETVGVTMYWNYLYGFPGETEDDYAPIVAQLPALHHLMPPTGATRIAVERFSPYFDDPALGFSELRPAVHYRVNYDLPEDELHDLAYVFDVPDAGITEDQAAGLQAGLREWSDRHAESRLSHVDDGERIWLFSERAGFPWREHQLVDPLRVALFRLLDDPRTVPFLARRLSEELGTPCGEDRVRGALQELRELGVVFADGDTFVHVAPAESNQPLLHVQPRFPAAVARQDRPDDVRVPTPAGAL
jgi:ribosomal peptide maturation radical SAM protein 1